MSYYGRTVAFLVMAAAARTVEAQSATVTISNLDPRRDTSGNIIDAHDGCLMQFGEKYYLYGTTYGNTDGFTTANHYRCYSSTDLLAWTLETENLLPGASSGVYYRPYVVRNAATGKYVLWYNWYPVLWTGQYGVATSDTPEGPFAIHQSNVSVQNISQGVGDQSLLIDEDGAAYLIYTTIDSHAVSIEKLAADYLSSTLQNSGLLASGVEAPALFKRNGIYYAVFGNTCPFCQQGSNAQVWTASNPLGPYAWIEDINPNGAPAIPAQQTYVAKLQTPNGDVYLWMGDRWGSTPDGTKGHDFQYWSPPLQFDAAGHITPLSWVDQWSLQISPPVPFRKGASRQGTCGTTGLEPVAILLLLRLFERSRNRG